MTRSFTLDRTNGKLMGVCAGLAGFSGADVTIVRMFAVLSVLVAGPLALFLYVVTGWIAPERA
jgi:phage shock protein C